MNPSVKPAFFLGRRPVGPGCPAFVIAEIGTAHGGDLKKAQALIEAAAESGADCAKFQVVFAEEILPPNAGLVPLPGGPTPLFEVFRRLERGPEFFARLKELTEAAGLVFLASPFGPRSARLLADLGCEAYKVASPELNYGELISQLAATGKPLILSSGVSRLSDLERALETLGPAPGAFLHCVTAYPAPEADYNLRVLPALATLTGRVWGVSDHSLHPWAVPLAARLEGAALIEKHICLDRNDPGLDDPIALDPPGFQTLVQRLRALEALPEPERESAALEALAGDPASPGLAAARHRLEALRGHGRKELAPAERANYGRTNRSLHALRDLPAGHRLGPGDLAPLRTEKVLRPGLGPEWGPRVLGCRLQRPLPAGEGLVWEDLLSILG